MKASVVIAARNAAETIGDQLAALAAQDYAEEWEVVVVDDHSIDDTPSVAQRFSNTQPLSLIASEGERGGANHARNLGVSASRGNVVALCDADDVCAPGWLSSLVDGLRRFDIVGGALDESQLNRPHVRAWRPPRPPGRLPVALGYLPYAVSANMAFHRAVWEDVGGFDESIARGGTEIDFCWRAQAAGYKLGYVPEAVVHYRLRPTIVGTAAQAYWYGRGDVRLARNRHLPRPVRHPLSRLLEPPNEPNVRWWQWMPGRLSYAAGYAVGTVTETLAEVG